MGHSRPGTIQSDFVAQLPVIGRDDCLSLAVDISQSSAREKAGLCLLVVDDNTDAAEAMAEFLMVYGHVVEVAHDAMTALKLAEDMIFDACLLDIGLPGAVDGNALATRLRSMPNTHTSILMAVTGYGQPSDRVRGMEAGFDHYLVKPVEMSKLTALIATHCLAQR